MPYSIIIADDHDIIREGIKSILGKNEDYEIIAEANNGLDTLILVEELHPDVLLLDITMPQKSGLDIIQQIHYASKDTKIVIVTMHRAPIYVQKVLKLGVSGYLHKENVSEDLLPALRRVMRGEVYLGSGVSEYLMGQDKNRGQTPISQKNNMGNRCLSPILTPREADILRLLVDGKTAKEIGEILFISRRTVENYKNNLLRKLGLHRSADLIKYAITHKIVDPEG